MSQENIDASVDETIREIVAEVVEVDVEKIGWNTDFWDDLDADSLQGIEILAMLERSFQITLDQGALSVMHDVESVYGVVMAAKAAGSRAS